jgi:FeS assembly SUF system protein
MDDLAFDPHAEAPEVEAQKRDVLDVGSPPAPATEESALPQEELDRLTEALIAQLKTVYDPEIPVDIYELGLVYKVDVSDERDVVVEMTLTAPGCPVAGDMPGWVQDAIEKIDGVRACKVELTFDPPWDPSRMSDEAKLQLNMF